MDLHGWCRWYRWSDQVGFYVVDLWSMVCFDYLGVVSRVLISWLADCVVVVEFWEASPKSRVLVGVGEVMSRRRDEFLKWLKYLCAGVLVIQWGRIDCCSICWCVDCSVNLGVVHQYDCSYWWETKLFALFIRISFFARHDSREVMMSIYLVFVTREVMLSINLAFVISSWESWWLRSWSWQIWIDLI